MHQPVMPEEAISSLNLKRGDIVLDATVGGGGHSGEILKRILPGGKLIGIDADPDALKKAENALKNFQGSFRLINSNFRNIDKVLSAEAIKSLDGILLDIGISSFQLEDPARGFGIKTNSRLDMRMDPSLPLTAYDIVNRFKEEDLSDMIGKFGEERRHNRIAHFICRERAAHPIETTHELAGIIRRAIGYGKQKLDPATRTFQAIRIAVNDELGALEEGLKKAVSWLDIGARIVVISFHSLEDRIVKKLFRGYSELGILKIITKKPLRPSHEEVLSNPRSRSARLRAAERI